jgi:hypothetical protein
MDLTLYNETSGLVQEVTINSLSELHDLIEVYFNIPRSNQSIKWNDQIINTSKSYGIAHGDLLTIAHTNNDSANHSDDMLIRAQISHTLCYVKGEYNNVGFKIMIDSGAQNNVITNKMANVLGLSGKIDTRMRGVAKGVGSSNVLGVICGCNIKFNDVMIITANFHVLETDGLMILFGLDFLNTHKCVLNFKNRTLEVDNEIINLMNEAQVDEYEEPFNAQKHKIQKYYREMNNTLTYSQKYDTNELIRKIINNILRNPHDDKYKSISLDSQIFKDKLANYQGCLDFMRNLGFKETQDRKFKFVKDIDTLNCAYEIMSS